MRLPRIATVLLTALTLSLPTAAPAAVSGPDREPGAAAAPLREPAGQRLDAIADAKKLATVGLSGANDWACRPSAAHPRPLILAHGTLANGHVWAKTAPQYKAAGYCVFSLDYGKGGGLLTLIGGGTAPVAQSAKQLAVFVNGVLAATGAQQVDIVGHSQGGMMPRQYMRFEGGQAKVHTLVGLGPSNHGSQSPIVEGLLRDQPWLGALLNLIGGVVSEVTCPACGDQIAGSPFLQKLNAGGDTLPGVSYTVIASRYDTGVTPYNGQYLKGPGVSNILMQDICPWNFASHSNLDEDPLALRLALNALDPAHAVKPTC
ncbi:alpha/beta fold hydrolase [Streptomyces sp. TRM66268-LWL]|uniref:Alpha/beta fold hydrolase n=1 Tax=Streptomyces polyasparticus TaxID=2767826 RepID=A0ABR7SKN4_9ACTN|nr:alpha/beta fold hydrolase [Streptomyces polyasparticus]MBC9715061.1 alpha/beta fold hydrolase [Streptomyces polyasparticus]